jgi:hypothetical protein
MFGSREGAGYSKVVVINRGRGWTFGSREGVLWQVASDSSWYRSRIAKLERGLGRTTRSTNAQLGSCRRSGSNNIHRNVVIWVVEPLDFVCVLECPISIQRTEI